MTCSGCWTKASPPISASVGCHHRRLRRAQRDADRLCVGACGAAAPRRAGRSGDRRCHPCGGVLQLGQSADVVAWRTRPAGRGIAISIRAATVLLPICRSPGRPKRDAAQSERAGAARHDNRRASPRGRPAASTGALDAELEYICSHPGMWRANSRDIAQHSFYRRTIPSLPSAGSFSAGLTGSTPRLRPSRFTSRPSRAASRIPKSP